MNNVIYLPAPGLSAEVIEDSALKDVSDYRQIFLTAMEMRHKQPDSWLLLAAFRRFAQVRNDREMAHFCDLFDEILED